MVGAHVSGFFTSYGEADVGQVSMKFRIPFADRFTLCCASPETLMARSHARPLDT